MISAPTVVTEFTGSHNAAPADFPQSYHAIEPVLLSRADNIRPYGGAEFTGSHNAAPADFSAVISPQSSLCFYRGRIISAPTAVTEFTGSHNAAPADFLQSYHRNRACAFIAGG
jgi:hypothetical protein